MHSDKFINSRPFYNITINEAQRELLRRALSVATATLVFTTEDTVELHKLADMMWPVEQNPEYGLQPSPAINSLCV